MEGEHVSEIADSLSRLAWSRTLKSDESNHTSVTIRDAIVRENSLSTIGVILSSSHEGIELSVKACRGSSVGLSEKGVTCSGVPTEPEIRARDRSR